MSDEGMVTMDEDEEIGQVRFVEYTCVLCFSLPFDRRDGGEMMIITSHRLPSFVVIAGGFYRALLLCELPNHSKLFFWPCVREERESETSSLALSKSKERTTINPTSEDGSLSLNVSLCFSFLFFLSLSLSLSLSGERVTRWIAT